MATHNLEETPRGQDMGIVNKIGRVDGERRLKMNVRT